MNAFVTAIGLVLVIEGLLYAACPGRMKAMMAQAEKIPAGTLRIAGVVAIAAGVFIVWLARRTMQ